MSYPELLQLLLGSLSRFSINTLQWHQDTMVLHKTFHKLSFYSQKGKHIGLTRGVFNILANIYDKAFL